MGVLLEEDSVASQESLHTSSSNIHLASVLSSSSDVDNLEMAQAIELDNNSSINNNHTVNQVSAGCKSTLLDRALRQAPACLKATPCRMHCLNSIGLKLVQDAREYLWSRHTASRIEWLYSKLSERSPQNGQLLFHIEGGKTLCTACFRRLYGINKNVYFKHLKKYNEGSRMPATTSGRRKTRVHVEAEGSRMPATTSGRRKTSVHVEAEGSRMPATTSGRRKTRVHVEAEGSRMPATTSGRRKTRVHVEAEGSRMQATTSGRRKTRVHVEAEGSRMPATTSGRRKTRVHVEAEGSRMPATTSGRRKTRVHVEAELWLEEYASSFGDSMPHTNTREILLPYKTRKLDIYQIYMTEKTNERKGSLARSTFLTMWKDEFAHLRIKQSNSFSKCDKCTTLEKQLEGTRNSNLREKYKKAKQEHLRRQIERSGEENANVWQCKNNSVSQVDEKGQTVSTYTFGKTNIPHIAGQRAKSLDAANLLQTHITGVINHGRKHKKLSTYMDVNEYQHDSNMVMNLILKQLRETTSEMRNRLPEVLYIQADNCHRENKNRYVLAFCELLVRLDIFKEVHLSFLFVGHTHEDIDAAFSKIAAKLRKTDAETIPALLQTIESLSQMNGLFDIKTWLSPYINKISKHSTPLHFKFSNGVDSIVCQYKGCSSRSWKNMAHPILKSVPAGRPMILVPPNFIKMNLNALGKNIEVFRNLFWHDEGNVKYGWWKSYITYLKLLQNNEQELVSYAKISAEWVLPLLPRQTSLDMTLEQHLPSHIQEMLDQEFEDPEVQVEVCRSQGRGRGRGRRRNTGHGRGPSTQGGTRGHNRGGVRRKSMGKKRKQEYDKQHKSQGSPWFDRYPHYLRQLSTESIQKHRELWLLIIRLANIFILWRLITCIVNFFVYILRHFYILLGHALGFIELVYYIYQLFQGLLYEHIKYHCTRRYITEYSSREPLTCVLNWYCSAF